MSKRKPVNYSKEVVDSSFDKSFESIFPEKEKTQESEIIKLRKEVVELKKIISNLKAQSCLKVETPRESTQKKIQEIEDITREIKKCLGISIGPTKSVDSVDKINVDKKFEKSDSTTTLIKEEESLQEMSSELMNMFVSFGF